MLIDKYYNKIIKGDCSVVLAKFPDVCVDMVVTSPPYDNLRDYHGYTFDFSGLAQQLWRVIKLGGVVVWVVGDATIQGSETGSSFKQALGFIEVGFNLHDTMIYEKNSFSFPAANRYHQTFEYMFILSKGKPKHGRLLCDRENKYRETWGIATGRNKDGVLFVRGKKKIW